MDREHLLGEEDGTVAGGLGAHLGAAPSGSLAGEHPGLVAVGDLAVRAEQVADLAAADADVAGRNVGVLAEVAVQLAHERLAEAHDLGVALAVRVEVRPALGAADALTGERVLEDLLEAEELDDRQVHRRVESQPALVRPENRRELDAVAAIDLHLSGVIDPGHAEHDLAFRLDDPVQDARLDVLRVLLEHRRDRSEHLVHGLLELGFVRAARQYRVENGLDGLGERVKFGESCGHAGRLSEWCG